MLPSIHHKLRGILDDIDSLHRDLHPEQRETPDNQVVIDRRLYSFDLSTRKGSTSLSPSINRFPKPLRQKIGPGYYYNSEVLPDAGNAFGFAPRFAESLGDKISSYHAKIVGPTAKERQVIAKRMRANTNLSLYRPQVKLEIMKRKSQLMAVREQLTRDVKESMAKHETEARLKKLQLKESKLELRLRKDEVIEISRGWLTLIGVVGCAFTSYKYALNRKRLHYRSSKVLKFLLIMAVCCGKIKVWLRKRRAKMALVKLQPIRFYTKLWVQSRRTILSNMVTDNIENSLTRNMLMRLMFDWSSRLKQLQRAMLYCLMCKKILYNRLAKQWDLVVGKKESVPFAIKVLFLRTAIKAKLKEHSEALALWNFTVITKSRKRMYRDPSTQSVIISKPTFSLKFAKEELNEINSKAMSRSNRWDYMLHRDKNIRRR